MTTPISPERAVYELPSISQAVISPDGSRIAFVRATVNRESNKPESHIWLCNADGSGRRQLTQASTGNSDPQWSPDGQHLAFVAERSGDHPNAICVLAFDGGEARVLTRHTPRPRGLAWSPDGARIAYVVSVDPDNPNETPRDPEAAPPVHVTRRFDYKQDGKGWVNDVRDQIFAVDVATSERKALTHDTVDHTRPTWSPDGSMLAITMPHNNGMLARIGLLDVASGEITHIGAEGGIVGIPAWSPDGTRLFFGGDEEGRPHIDYFVYTLADKHQQKIADNATFTGDAYYWVENAPVWLDDQRVLVSGMEEGRSGLWTVEIASGTIAPFGRWDAGSNGMSASADGKTLVQVTSNLDGFAGLAAIDLGNGERTLLHDEAGDFFRESPPAQWEAVSVEREGVTIHGWLLKPADFDERKRYPLIIDIHGGPHGAYSHGFNVFAEIPATHGYLVLLANPRGSSSYGREFTEGCIQDWGGGDWQDLLAILDHVVQRPYVDADRTGVYGYSYGGFMTAWALGQTNRFKAAICGAPVFDLVSMYGSSDVGHAFLGDHIGGLPWTAPEAYEKHSPSTYIHNATTPTLVVCGEADERCPTSQSEMLYISLKKLGVDTEFARYPGGAHGFLVAGPPAHRLDFLQRYLDWFGKYLGEPT